MTPTDLRTDLLRLLRAPRPAAQDEHQRDDVVLMLSRARAGAYLGCWAQERQGDAEGAQTGRRAVLDAIGESGDSAELDCLIEHLTRLAGQLLVHTLGDWAKVRGLCREFSARMRAAVYLGYWAMDAEEGATRHVESMIGRLEVLDAIAASGDQAELTTLLEDLAGLAGQLLEAQAGGDLGKVRYLAGELGGPTWREFWADQR